MSTLPSVAESGNTQTGLIRLERGTDHGAPCCYVLVNEDTGEDVLVQTDWDYPGVASSFGWSTRNAQRCPDCGSPDIAPTPDYRGGDNAECQDCGAVFDPCDHPETDGTVDCERCGMTAAEMIRAAREWLDDHIGETAEDPGYFSS